MTQMTTDETNFNEAFGLLNEALSTIPSTANDIVNQTKKFLHNIELSDEQQKVAKMESTHLLVKGTAGSGKSITLLTRMMQKMSEEFGKRFLFVSYSEELIKDAQNRFRQSEYYDALQEHNHRVDFLTFHELAHRLLASIGVKVRKFRTNHKGLNRGEDEVRARILRLMDLLESDEFKELPAIHTIKKTQNTSFLSEEFAWMKGNGFITEEDYLLCDRVGRGQLPNISVKQRSTIFRLFVYYQEDQLKNFYNRVDPEDFALLIMKNFHLLKKDQMYDHIFIDEVQDLQPMQLRVLVAFDKGTLSLSGDERQRIYKSSPFSYKALGINIRSGNNVVLKRNWRSTYSIMKLANSLNFNRSSEDSKYDDEKYFPRPGEKPQIKAFKTYVGMLDEISTKIRSINQIHPNRTFAIIHRRHETQDENNIKIYLEQYFKLRTYIERSTQSGHRQHGPKVYLIEAKATKGLEFDYVFILDIDKKHYPHRDEVESLNKVRLVKSKSPDFEADKKELEEKEKRILYVSLTRAKQLVFMYYHSPKHPEIKISPFVKDFDTRDYEASGFRKTLL
ncbi:3'-5' exonuclease [Rossellomorea aquimaris]|uniref:3'-5' exonuclease n=1 Tax=Rossellomorea aquimaris TaxID=189382 RepID=UPI0007D0B939|nr:3'-5' exonuclease [Rossellomorea aquimaris]